MSRPHASAVVEDAWHRCLGGVLRHRHWGNRVIGYTGYGSTDTVRVLARVLLGRERGPEDRHDVTYAAAPSPYASVRGWRSFFTVPAERVPVSVRVGAGVANGRSDRTGHVDVTVPGHGLAPGWHEATVCAEDAEPVQASVLVVDPTQDFGIVSDVDDTVISTSLPRPMIAAWNTFVRHESARRSIPGMAALYRGILDEHPGAPVVYVSTGAWNTAPTLNRFLQNHGYPPGPLLLTDWGPTNTGWFRSGREHKRTCLDRLADDFPGIRWLLVGDDGQHDPAVYREFAEARPGRVEAIVIRQLSATEQVLSHGLPVSQEDPAARPRSSPGVPVFSAPDGYALLRLLWAVGRVGAPRAESPPLEPPVADVRPESA